MSKNFSGVATALVTPFNNKSIDFKSVERLVNFQIENGVEALVVNGTTGESPSLTQAEVKELYQFVRKIVGDDFPIILGTGSNSTDKTIDFTKKAEDWGVDAALVVAPYYNKPPQEGLFLHFSEVAKNTKLPVLLYNVPGRTIISIEPETVVKLSAIDNIVGIKEASGNIEAAKTILANTNNFLLTSGDDATCIDFMLAGGQGVISVISHVIPKELRALSDRARQKDSAAKEDYKKFDSLNALMGIEANPIPVKMALYKMGIISSPELRLPLRQLKAEFTSQLVAELTNLGIQNG